MFKNTQSLSYSRKSAGVLLLVGVLAGVTVGGGVGVIAASTSKTVTVCADKKSNILRYAKNGKCSRKETRVVLNQTGETGPAGSAGPAGPDPGAGPDPVGSVPDPDVEVNGTIPALTVDLGSDNKPLK